MPVGVRVGAGQQRKPREAGQRGLLSPGPTAPPSAVRGGRALGRDHEHGLWQDCARSRGEDVRLSITAGWQQPLK